MASGGCPRLRQAGERGDPLDQAVPETDFLDRACTVPFPIALPSPDRVRFHGIVVARGAKDACRKHFGGGTGSLMLKSGEGDIFCIGEVNDGRDFIHVSTM